MNKIMERVIRSVKKSVRPAWSTAWWMLRMMLPITIGVAVLNYLGVIDWISQLLSPLLGLMGLPGKAGLVLITSALANLYSAIAVMASLNLDLRSITILAVMCLIAHNLIIESVVQQKTGVSIKLMVPLRICSSLVAGMLLNGVLPTEMSGNPVFSINTTHPESWREVVSLWVDSSVPLIVKMLVIIFALNVLQSLLREFKVIDWLIYPLRPLMRIFGLNDSVAFLWIVANIIGLAYGGAILIDEVRRGVISHRDSLLFNSHVALSHSLLEDTIIFVTIGVGLGWLLIPRLLLAIAAVWGVRYFTTRSWAKA